MATNQNGIIIQAPASSAGCWVDGHLGQYAVAEMVTIAADHGYSDETVIDIANRHLACMGPSDAPEITDAEFDTLMWGADEAEAWMNANVAPSGFYFCWEDGEFILWDASEVGDDEDGDDEDEPNPYGGEGGLLDEIRQAERLIGSE